MFKWFRKTKLAAVGLNVMMEPPCCQQTFHDSGFHIGVKPVRRTKGAGVSIGAMSAAVKFSKQSDCSCNSQIIHSAKVELRTGGLKA